MSATDSPFYSPFRAQPFVTLGLSKKIFTGKLTKGNEGFGLPENYETRGHIGFTTGFWGFSGFTPPSTPPLRGVRG